MSKKPDARTFGQDLMRGEHAVGGGKPKLAIPGGGTGPNSAYKFKTREGYKTQAEIASIPSGLLQGQMPNNDGAERAITGTSIFDPVLAEIAYRWFCPPKGLVLDPFAGGSVRGIVACKLGRRYVGVDLSAAQIAANEVQGAAICPDNRPDWRVGDSLDIDSICADVEADFIFSCPPFADLEVYSDNPRDLSTMAYADFRDAYAEIIRKACSLLKPNRFAGFVVGEVRDAKGMYYGLVPDTIRAFQAAGLAFYNEAILITAAGSLPIRAGKQFEATRKLGKTHQNCLFFLKGEPKAATKSVGKCEFGAISEENSAELTENARLNAIP